MRDIASLADQHRCRAQEMRIIAEGIWDDKERTSLIEFIEDYERLAHAVKIRDPGITLPTMTQEELKNR